VETFRAIQIEALVQVLAAHKDKDTEYHIRRIMRTYSARFHTPLHQVMELPFLDVMRHYFESEYEELEDEQLEEERRRLTETPEEKIARSMESESDSVEDDEYVRELEAQLAREEVGRRNGDPMIRTPAGGQTFDVLPEDRRRAPDRGGSKEPEIVSSPVDTPIKMTFVDLAAFEKEIQQDFLGSSSPSKKRS
jgi:hypothetical protein